MNYPGTLSFLLKALCFFLMLKSLIPCNSWGNFDLITERFLAKTTVYNDQSFMRAYQLVTDSKIFTTDAQINHFFASWMAKWYYPIVKVTRAGNQLKFGQIILPQRNNTPYMIPVSIVTEKNAKRDLNKVLPDLWLVTARADEGSYDIPGPSKWYLVNNQRSAYFRVLYDDWNYKLLRFELIRGDMNKISPITRGQIIDDAMMLGFEGYLSYGLIIELLEYLANETEEIPWLIADYQLTRWDILMRFTPAYPYFKHFIKLLIERFYAHSVETAASKSKVGIRLACFAGLQECLDFTHELFLGFVKNRNTYEHMEEIICQGMAIIDDTTFNYIKLSILNDLRGMEMDLYILAMVCAKNYDYVKESLNMFFRETSEVAEWLKPKEKVDHLINMCKYSDTGVKAVLDFVYQHPDLVFKNLADSILGVLTRLSESLYKRSHQRKINHIIKVLNLNLTEQIFRNIRQKKAWVESNYLIVSKILYNYASVDKFQDYIPF